MDFDNINNEYVISNDMLVCPAYSVPAPIIHDPETIVDELLDGNCYDVTIEDIEIDNAFFKYDKEKDVVEYFLGKSTFGISVFIPFANFIVLLENCDSSSEAQELSEEDDDMIDVDDARFIVR